jgi:hypothetical protein
MLRLLGDADKVKSGAGGVLTVREIVAELVKLPDMPMMVTVLVPVVAVLLTVNVKVLLPVVLVGLKEAITPEGKPETDKPTLLLKPFSGKTVIVLVPVFP